MHHSHPGKPPGCMHQLLHPWVHSPNCFPASAADRLRGFRIRVARQPPTDPQHFIDGVVCYDKTNAQGPGTAEYDCAGGGIAGRYLSVQIYDRAE